jgi:hypothetical protein
MAAANVIFDNRLIGYLRGIGYEKISNKNDVV